MTTHQFPKCPECGSGMEMTHSSIGVYFLSCLDLNCLHLGPMSSTIRGAILNVEKEHTTMTTNTTTLTPHKWAEVIHAWADGKDIQYAYCPSSGPWTTYNGVSPNFHSAGVRWRVAPPEPKRWSMWLNVYTSGPGVIVTNSREGADKYSSCDRLAVIRFDYEQDPETGKTTFEIVEEETF